MSLALVSADSHFSDLDLYGILCSSSTCLFAGIVSNYLAEAIPGLNMIRQVESILKRIISLRIVYSFLIGETFSPYFISKILLRK